MADEERDAFAELSKSLSFQESLSDEKSESADSPRRPRQEGLRIEELTAEDASIGPQKQAPPGSAQPQSWAGEKSKQNLL